MVIKVPCQALENPISTWISGREENCLPKVPTGAEDDINEKCTSKTMYEDTFTKFVKLELLKRSNFCKYLRGTLL